MNRASLKEIKVEKRTKIEMVLIVLVVLTMARQFIHGNYDNMFLCALTLVLFLVPKFIEKELNVSLPAGLETVILLFIFSAEILGEIGAFYLRIPGWDTMLHTINGFLMAAIGFALIDIFNRSERFSMKMSPYFVAFVAFCFSMTIGVLWEFFEFFMDRFMGTDMQKDWIVQSITSVMLNPDGANVPVTVPAENVAVNGKDLGLGGYLDIGLIDTMKDLLVNFIGAVVFSAIGVIYLKNRGRGRLAASLIPVVLQADPEEKGRKDIIESGNALVEHNYVSGTWGNVSCRIVKNEPDGRTEFMIITPSGIPYERLSPEDLVVMPVHGDRKPEGGKPSSEYRIHREIYIRNSEASFAVHTHQKWLNALAVTGHTSGVYVQGGTAQECDDADRCGESYSRIKELRRRLEKEGICFADYAPAGSIRLAENVGDSLDRLIDEKGHLPDDAVLVLARHGALVWGRNSRECFEKIRKLEKKAEEVVREITGGDIPEYGEMSSLSYIDDFAQISGSGSGYDVKETAGTRDEKEICLKNAIAERVAEEFDIPPFSAKYTRYMRGRYLESYSKLKDEWRPEEKR